MKRCFVIAVSLFLAFAIGGRAWADDQKKVAVFPFAVHSSEDLDYIRNGIWDMLISRIGADNEISVIDKKDVAAILKGKDGYTADDVYRLGEQLGAHYVTWGSITKIGSSVSLDGKLLDVMTNKTPVNVYEQCKSVDDIIPKVNLFSKKIIQHVTGSVPESIPTVREDAEIGEEVVQQKSTDPVKALQTRRGTMTAVYNPEFVFGAGPIDRENYWISQRFPAEFRGMAIGDVNGDGLNEIVVIDVNKLSVFRREGKNLKTLATIPGERYDEYISVDVADINRNGVAEIFVSNIRARDRVASFVVEYKNEQYAVKETGIDMFLRVIEPYRKPPYLIGQILGSDHSVPFEKPIYKLHYKGGKYERDKRLPIPQGLSVYGLTIDRVGDGGERVIALDENDHLRMYAKTTLPIEKIHIYGGSEKSIWKSEEIYGGSDTIFQLQNKTTLEDECFAYVNPRIITYDTNDDGKQEVIIVRNISAAGRTFEHTRVYTKSELFDLEWDGLGLIINWKTKKIGGYVADYQIKDIDNDGEDDVVLALRVSPTRSVIVAYKLSV